MGTNFYLLRDCCEHCGRPAERIHIGKSSGGWMFGLHVKQYEWETTPSNLEEWKELWSQPGNRILDEYGERLTPQEMFERITDRHWKGPGGLRRHEVDHHFCIAHGSGTWDLCVGEFS